MISPIEAFLKRLQAAGSNGIGMDANNPEVKLITNQVTELRRNGYHIRQDIIANTYMMTRSKRIKWTLEGDA